jgi:hypothetical protein
MKKHIANRKILNQDLEIRSKFEIKLRKQLTEVNDYKVDYSFLHEKISNLSFSLKTSNFHINDNLYSWLFDEAKFSVKYDARESYDESIKKENEELKDLVIQFNEIHDPKIYLKIKEILSRRKERIKEELYRALKLNNRQKRLIINLLRFINFSQNMSSIYRRFILRFNFKNMSDESGSGNNIVVFNHNLYYSLIPIINEKSRQRILY